MYMNCERNNINKEFNDSKITDKISIKFYKEHRNSNANERKRGE